MDLKKICKWFVELNTEKKKLFNDYFIDDIVRYLEIDEIHNNVNLEKILKTYQIDYVLQEKTRNDLIFFNDFGGFG